MAVTWETISKSIFGKSYSDNVWESVEKSLYGDFLSDDDIMEKAGARGGKYIQRIPTGKKERPWAYIYAEDLLHPFKCLETIFGLAKAKIAKSFKDNRIKEEYDVDQETYGKHLLEFFRHKDRWETTFADKGNRDKFKKPVSQGKLAASSEKDLTESENDSQLGLFEEKKQAETKNKLNRSLMRKIWTLYSPNGKKIADAEKNLESTEKKVEQKAEQKTAGEIQKQIEFAEKQKKYFLDAAENHKGKNEKLYELSVTAANDWERRIGNYRNQLAEVNGETAKETPAEEVKANENTPATSFDKDHADHVIARFLGDGNIKRAAEYNKTAIANNLYGDTSMMNTDTGRNTIDYVYNKIQELSKLSDKELKSIYRKEYKAIYDSGDEEIDYTPYINDSINIYKDASIDEVKKELEEAKASVNFYSKEPLEKQRIKLLEAVLQYKESNPAEEHENRSQAMMGNDNAKKDFTELDAELIRNANQSSYMYEPGDAINREYKGGIEAIDSWDLTDEEKEAAKKKLFELTTEQLKAQAKAISVTVAGPARKVNGSDNAFNKVQKIRGEIKELLDKLRKKNNANVNEQELKDLTSVLREARNNNKLAVVYDGSVYYRGNTKSTSWNKIDYVPELKDTDTVESKKAEMKELKAKKDSMSFMDKGYSEILNKIEKVRNELAYMNTDEWMNRHNAIRKAIDILDSGILFQKSTGRLMFRKSMF